jgi:hypothetical protein
VLLVAPVAAALWHRLRPIHIPEPVPADEQAQEQAHEQAEDVEGPAQAHEPEAAEAREGEAPKIRTAQEHTTRPQPADPSAQRYRETLASSQTGVSAR